MTVFKDKTLMITGGTGSFGNTVLKHFLSSDIGEIRIFSRDEKKQDDMRHELQAKHPEYANKVKFYIGDVRNIQSIRDAIVGVDYVFHAAALKQVPSCEFYPMEAVRTNIEGTDNLLHAAIEEGVKNGKDVILEIEVAGAMQIKQIYPEAVFIFVVPPSLTELESRLVGRNTEAREVIEQRLARAKEELALYKNYDYVVVNDRLVEAIDEIKCIVRAEKLKSDFYQEKIENVIQN